MRNKNKWNRCKALFGLALLACTMLGAPAVLPVKAAIIGGPVQTYREIITWQYKIENKKLYKRLWNNTTCVWLTEWIFVRDLSEDL